MIENSDNPQYPNSQESLQNTGSSNNAPTLPDQHTNPDDNNMENKSMADRKPVKQVLSLEKNTAIKSLISNIKGKLGSVLSKVKTAWQRLPRKYKIPIVASSGILIVLLSVSFLTLIKSGKLSELVRRDADFDFAQFGDWKKLEIPQREKPFFTLAATTVSKHGILPKEVFVLKSREPVDEVFVKNNIKASVPVRVASISKSEYKITPDQNLGLDQVITLELDIEDKDFEGHKFDRDYSWAYQTQGKFRVVSSIPGDKKTEVPVNTGVEIVFSQDDFNNPEPFISISPTLEYRTEVHAETFVIVPIGPLNEKTVYTVTLKKGLNLKSRNDPIDEDFSFSFQTKEKGQRPARFYMREDFQQVSPDEPLITKVDTSNWKAENVIKTEVYKFSSSQAFIDSRETIDNFQSSWMRYYAEEETVDTSGLEKVLTVDLRVQSKERVEYLQLPDALPQGFYIAQFWSEERDKLEQLWLQSTTLTGYVSVGKEQTVVWANHFDSGPTKNAVIRIVGTGGEYRTYDNGVSVFNTPPILFEESRHYLEIKDENQNKVILPVFSLKGESSPGKVTQEDYWSYLYNERYLYKPGDTVYFFGVVKNRNSNQSPSLVEVSLGLPNYKEEGQVSTKNIAPSSDGSFIGNFELIDVPRGWYNLTLKVGGVKLASSGFNVTEFEKPEMKIEVSADRKAVFTDEEVNYSAKVTFFDGTTASNIPVKIHESKTGKSTEVKTGENGEISYTYKTTYQSGRVYYPRYESITFTPSVAQEKIVEGYGSVYVYGSRLIIRSESEQDGSKAKLKAYVNHVDLSKVNSGESSEVKADPAKDQPTKLKITKTWYEKKEIGTYYDFIEKVTRKSYDYIRHTEIVDERTINSNENGELSHEFTLEEKKSYTAELEVNDVDGHPVKTSEYYYYHSSSSNYESTQREFPQLNLDREESIYSVGEEVNLNIMLGDSEYPDNEKNRFLFIVANRGKQEVVLSNGPNFNFQFENKHIPNIYVGALIFTGKYYSTAAAPCRWDWHCSYYYYFHEKTRFNGLQISYEKQDSGLDLTIDTNLSEYEPGGEATISVRVEKAGNPVAGANVNLVLVDQALAAMGVVKEPSILSSVYKSVQSQIYYNYSTHEPVFPDEPAAEMGGGGGGDREIFKDAAFFGLKTTNENGNATFKFTLPDNITSWVIYAQAVTESIDAGQEEGNLIVTKDFFITSNFPREYLLGDKPYITGGSYGEKLEKDTTVNFKALFFEGDKEIKQQDKSTGAYKSINFPFPELSTGEYNIVLRGKVGDLEDGVKLPFRVTDTRFVFENYKKHALNKGQVLNSAGISNVLEDKPVKLIISDLGKGIYYSSLYRYCYISSNRLEKHLTKSAVSIILKDRFEDETCKIDYDALKKFQYLDGGLSQVNWGSSNLRTTAWAIYVNPDPFNKDNLISFLEGKLENSRGGTIEKTYSAWGLTELDVPQVNELRVLSENASTYEEKIITGIALASVGETEKARELYYDVLANYAYEYKPYIRIQAELKGEREMDSYIKNTAHALLLGSLVEKSYNEGLFNYLRDFGTNAEDIVIDLGAISFIEEELSKLPDENTKIYFKSASHEVEKELKNGRSFALPLRSNDVDNFTLKVLEGKAEAFFSYFVGPEGFSQLDSDEKLTIKRTYKKAKGEGSKIKTGDIIEIRVDFNVDFEKSPPGGYRITDHLPSGLKYISNPNAYGLKAEGWTRETNNNIISSYFYNSPWWQQHGRKYVIYYARVSSVGEYVAEPAVMQSLRYLDVFQNTDGETIKTESSNL